jgi:hypothetical protein
VLAVGAHAVLGIRCPASPPPRLLLCFACCLATSVLSLRYSLLRVPLAEELNDALVGDLLNVRRERGHFDCVGCW